MSAQGDQAFLARIRTEIAAAIQNEVPKLIARTSDRQAGFIQGLEASLELINRIVEEINQSNSPANRKNNGSE